MNTEQLKAFLTLQETGTFTKAAKELGMTQSALSQKIAKLEDELEVSLLVRKTKGLELTAPGEKLLVFAKEQLSSQENFLNQFKQTSETLAGNFRLAGFSSIVRSILIPRLSSFLRKNQDAFVEFSTHEVVDLVQQLKTNNADAIVLDYFPNLQGIEQVQIGEEEYVVIESAKHKNTPNIFLDHGPHDNATESFFNFQGKKTDYRRGFMGDVYGILDGVAAGLGKAVMSKHLIENDKRFKIIKSKRRYIRPIVLCYYQQNYYSPLQKKITELLTYNL